MPHAVRGLDELRVRGWHLAQRDVVTIDVVRVYRNTRIVCYGGVMLIKDDVPSPWRVVLNDGQSTIPAPESNALEDALGITTTDDERNRVSWDMIEHEPTGVRAILRMIPTYADSSPAVPIGTVVSAIVARPPAGLNELTVSALRDLRADVIQANASIRWASTSTLLADLMQSDDPVETHLASAAARWMELAQQMDPNPSSTLAAERGVTASTARRWIASARERGMIPEHTRRKPGRRPKDKE